MAKGRKEPMWFVVGNATTKHASVWLSTASFTKRGAIQHWQEQMPDGDHPWSYWYRNGSRALQVTVRCQIHRR